jgi:hypothetical protein
LLSLLLVPTPGCSLVLVDSPKRNPQTRVVTCSDTYTWPAIDTAVAILQVARTIYALSQSDADYRGATIPRDADIAIGIGLTGLFGGSAAYGYGRVNACHEEYELDRQSVSTPPRRRRVVPPPVPRAPPPAAPPADPEPTKPSPDAQAGAPESATPTRLAPAPQQRDSE